MELKTVDGDYNGVKKEFYAGQSALIRAECTVCGAEGEHEEIPATSHDYEEISRVNTDSEHYKVTYKCKKCNSEYSKTVAGQV